MTTSGTISIASLREAVRGPVIGPGDEGYDAARTPFVGGVDRHPAAVVRVADADDVRRVVGFAREAGAELAIRSGGHGAAAHCVSDGGIVLDLSDRKAIEIDAAARTAWAETGLTAAEYARAAAAHDGLVTGFGDTGSVGVGGITLGGGVGYLARNHGLTIDDLLEAEIVTADAELLRVDAESHPDLFWAIRGGGGNFGVATRFRLRLHEHPTVVAGMLMLPATAETIQGFLAEARQASEDFSAIVNVMPAPPMPFVPPDQQGKIVILALVCYSGDPSDGDAALAPFRALAEPIADMVRPIPYPEIYPPEDEGFHPVSAGHAFFVDEVDEASVRTILERLESWDAMMRVAQIRVLGGAMSRIPNDATAFAHRDRAYMVTVASIFADPAERPRHEAWIESFAAELQRGPKGVYVSFLPDVGPERIREAYPGATWDRLRQVKRTYDPTNLFRLNQNVPPADR